MKTRSTLNTSAKIYRRKESAIIGFAVALTLFVGSASAQVEVIDTPGGLANKAGFAAQLAKTIDQYTTQLTQLQQEVAQYQQILMTVQGLGTNITFGTNQLKPISDPLSLVDQNCPGASGGVVSGLVTSVVSAVSSSQSIVAAQQQLCAQITLVQIDEFNKTVTMANQLDTFSTGTLQKLNQLANEVNSLGTTSGATTQVATFSATVGVAMDQWKSQVDGDEKLLSALQQQQGVLARVAMRGQNTILGNVVQAGALKAWFAANPYNPN